MDVGKAIDKAAGADREVVGQGLNAARRPNPIRTGSAFSDDACVWGQGDPITAPATPEAERWSGWGSALKPAHEPIVVARKPLSGTIAGNVLEHGCGALNIDGCRIGTDDNLNGGAYSSGGRAPLPGDRRTGPAAGMPTGRWPANVVLDEAAAARLDEMTGTLTSGSGDRGATSRVGGIMGAEGNGRSTTYARDTDSGGASRFLYVAKASAVERSAGLESKPMLRLRCDLGSDQVDHVRARLREAGVQLD